MFTSVIILCLIYAHTISLIHSFARLLIHPMNTHTLCRSHIFNAVRWQWHGMAWLCDGAIELKA